MGIVDRQPQPHGLKERVKGNWKIRLIAVALLSATGVATYPDILNIFTPAKPDLPPIISPPQIDTGTMPSQSVRLQPESQSAEEIPQVQDVSRGKLPEKTIPPKNPPVEITEDMIKSASPEQVATLQKQAIEKGENKIPAPVKGRYGEYELINGVRGITITLSPGTYIIWTHADDEAIIRRGEFSDSLIVTPKNTIIGSPFFRIFYNFPHGIATFPEKEIIGKNKKQLATLTISPEDSDQLIRARQNLLKSAKEGKDIIKDYHFSITAAGPSGGLNKGPMLKKIFLTDPQGQIPTLHSSSNALP